MKKTICILITIITAFSAYATDYEYVPLVQEGRVWEYYAEKSIVLDADTTLRMEFIGDTIINDTTFKKLYAYDNKKYALPSWPIAYMCEIDKKVYAKANLAMVDAFISEPIYNGYSFLGVFNNKTKLMFDFNDISNKKYMGINFSVTPTVSQIEIDGKLCNKSSWVIYEDSTKKKVADLIEGIGPNFEGTSLVKNYLAIGALNQTECWVLGLKYVKDKEGRILFRGRGYEIEKSTNKGTGITDVKANRTIESVLYYNLQGHQRTQPFSGVNIVVTRYTDGSTTTTKTLQ